MLDSLLPHLASEKVVVATSREVANRLKGVAARSYSRQEMLGILAQSKYAIMTPGLGNIYDAAHFDVPTLWLPPANDSQGQQRVLLQQEQMCDAQVDWADILPSTTIDYHAPQIKVLQQITHAVGQLADKAPSCALKTALGRALKDIQHLQHSAATDLITRFGRGGAQQVAGAIYQFMKGKLDAEHF